MEVYGDSPAYRTFALLWLQWPPPTLQRNRLSVDALNLNVRVIKTDFKLVIGVSVIGCFYGGELSMSVYPSHWRLGQAPAPRQHCVG